MPKPLQLELTRHELFTAGPNTPAIGPAFRVEITPEHRPAFFAIARLTTYTRKNNTDCYRVFFHNEGRPHDEIFSTRGDSSVDGEEKRHSSEGLFERVTRLANRAVVTRFWQSPDASYCIALNSNGTGRVLQQQGRPEVGDVFRWNVPQKEDVFWKGSTADFHAFCHQLTQDSNSGCNFAVNWQKLPSEEKWAFATSCEHGEWQQLLRLMTCVLRIITHHFGSYPYDNNTVSWWHFASPIEKRHDRPAVFFARRWQEAIYKIFRPSFWPHTPRCVVGWRAKEPGFENYVACDIPTMHEFLEAQLQLRDFLRPHLMEAEIERLLTP